uniref:Alternative protein PTPRU n=1 Tax=Homo sapiens TaxID=9606 RepID=L8ECC6_HUMAN|nr:alternative protein PTPRU [Homo sapiens]
MWPWSTWRGWSQDSGALAWGTHCTLRARPTILDWRGRSVPPALPKHTPMGQALEWMLGYLAPPSTVGRAFRLSHGRVVGQGGA